MISNSAKRMSSSFGSITIDNRTYSDDVIITNEGIKLRDKELSRHYAKDYGGHVPLSKAELVKYIGHPEDYIKKPIIFIGTGQSGKLPLTPDAKLFLASFTVIAKPTPEVLQFVQKELRKFIAIIHTTC